MKALARIALAALALAFAVPAAAQSPSQSSDSASGSRINRPPPLTPQGSPQETVALAKQRIDADKKMGRVPDRKTL